MRHRLFSHEGLVAIAFTAVGTPLSGLLLSSSRPALRNLGWRVWFALPRP